MRQKLITLDPTSWDLAAKKSNFSQWVRDKLRSEDNRRSPKRQRLICSHEECWERRYKNTKYCIYHYDLTGGFKRGEEE